MTQPGAEARYGYHGDGQLPVTAQPPSAWHFGTLQWGPGDGGTWGSFGAGWRPEDGTKLNRPANGAPFAGMGWSYGYDAGVRLTSATSPLDEWGYGYGLGDERKSENREKAGELLSFTSGADGRITGRNAATFAYDPSGRRTEDERFVYRWDWRGQLISATVKDSWPAASGDGEGDLSPYAGHRIEYEYDASGRLLTRKHLGKRAAGAGDESRPFIELREYVWNGASLATEVAYGAADKTQPRWRKTYVPGTSGLDDAVQVMVEVESTFPGNPYAGQTELYTFLRDEMGSVVGLVADGEPVPGVGKPPMPVRYLYTPYGDSHAETGPELRRAHFEASVTTGGSVPQNVLDEHRAAPGAMVLDWSLEIEEGSLGGGLKVEKLDATQGRWEALSPAEVTVAAESAEGDQGRVVAMALRGWEASTSYRLRIKPELQDTLGRAFGQSETLEWRIPDPPAEPSEPVASASFDKKYPLLFETWDSARNTLAGRFPGGQTDLFQGLWTDPVTGIAYARARWYDARNASWLSEDPMGAVDSPNRYAFVGHLPSMRIDPLGEESMRQAMDWESDLMEDRPVRAYFKMLGYSVWNTFTFGFVAEHDEVFEQYSGSEYVARATAATGKAVAIGAASLATGGAVGAATRGTSLVVSGALVGTSSTAAGMLTEDAINLGTNRPTHSGKEYAVNLAGSAAFGAGIGLAGTRFPRLLDPVFSRQPPMLATGNNVDAARKAQLATQGYQTQNSKVSLPNGRGGFPDAVNATNVTEITQVNYAAKSYSQPSTFRARIYAKAMKTWQYQQALGLKTSTLELFAKPGTVPSAQQLQIIQGVQSRVPQVQIRMMEPMNGLPLVVLRPRDPNQ